LGGSVHVTALWFEDERVESDASLAALSFFSGKALFNTIHFASSFSRVGEMNLASEREVLQ
jgi:hypothetical protein